MMNTQGILRTQSGAPVSDGQYDLSFALYPDQADPAPVWSEVVPKVTVQGGFYSAVVGGVVPLPADLFKQHAELWLGVRVGTGTDLPRGRLLTVAYAFDATHASVAATSEALQCTGCVAESSLGFDLCTASASCPLPFQVGTGLVLTSGSLGVDAAIVQNWSGLVCYDTPAELRAALDAVYAPQNHTHPGKDITSPVAEALLAADSQALGGNSLAQVLLAALDAVASSGYQMKTDKIDASQLPANGLSAVSNGLLTNQFQDTTASADTPVAIKDYFPPGVSSTLQFPDVGTAEALTVTVNLTNSDISGISVTLEDPANVTYVLYDRGETGTSLNRTYPTPSQTAGEDLARWLGMNPKGTWTLTVIDSKFASGSSDGQLNSWSVSTRTLSTKKIRATGDIDIDGHRLYSLPEPSVSHEAATKQYVDSRPRGCGTIRQILESTPITGNQMCAASNMFCVSAFLTSYDGTGDLGPKSCDSSLAHSGSYSPYAYFRCCY
jgi:subtilisin-like proprotein convertase family protein